MDRLEEIAARSKLVVDGKHGAALTCEDIDWLVKRLRLASAVVAAAEWLGKTPEHDKDEMLLRLDVLMRAVDAYRKEEE